MRHLTIILMLLLILLTFAMGKEALSAVRVDGEIFANDSIVKLPNGDIFIEFIREGESFDNWTKLVGYLYQQVPELENDPIKFAANMEQLIKQANPKANLRMLNNEKSKESIIDYLTWGNNPKYMELNIFRFWKSMDEKAIVSLQLAYRFEHSKVAQSPEEKNELELNVKKLAEMRKGWLKEVFESDKKIVENALLSQ